MNTNDFSLLRRFLAAEADNDNKLGCVEYDDGYSLLLYRRVGGTGLVLLSIHNLSSEPSDGIEYVDISLSLIEDAPDEFPADEDELDELLANGKNIIHLIESPDSYTSLQNMSAAYLILLDTAYRAMCLCNRVEEIQ